MKRLLIFALIFILSGCSAVSPLMPAPAATSTPETVIQTVVVTVLVTQVVTVTPSSTPTATLTPIPTFTPEATALTTETPATATTGTAPANTGTATPASGETATATLPVNAGGGLFSNLTRSSDHFSLNCQPDTITFGVSATDPNVAEVDLFYRMEDKLSSSISGWIDIGKMESDGAGNFTMDFKSSMVDPDLRSHQAWFDYQFIGLSKAAQVLGRSAKIVKQITYTIDCP